MSEREDADWRRQVNQVLGELTGEVSALGKRLGAAGSPAAAGDRLDRLERRVAALEETLTRIREALGRHGPGAGGGR